MLDTSLQGIIETYAWAVAGIIMIVITIIARFYQEKFGIKTFYYFYLIPIFLLFISATHVFSYDTVLTESTEIIGSATSFLSSYYLYRIMVGVK